MRVEQRTGPLAGVRVLDLSSVVMGPYATQTLADLGAEVTFVEGARVDINRVMGPGPLPAMSGVALNMLRNKRSVMLDISTEAGHEVVIRLATEADVVVTNLRPGSLKRAGLSYDDIAAVNPKVVYCEAHGFASDTPDAEQPAYDDVIQAASGLADAAQRQTGIPALAPTILADKVCALTIVYSVTAALYRRATTGQGERIEVPMLDTAKAFMLAEHGSASIPEPQLGTPGYQRILAPNRRPQRTTDGWIHVLPYTRTHYRGLFEEAGRPEVLEDDCFATPQSLIANADFVYGLVAEIIATRSTADWLDICRKLDIPAVKVASLQEIVDELPIVDDDVVGPWRQIPQPVRFAGAPTEIRRRAPLRGEHTEEVLAELGYTPAEIESMRASGAIPADRHADAQADRHADAQADRHADAQADSHADRRAAPPVGHPPGRRLAGEET